MTDTLDAATSADARWHRLDPRMLLIHPIIELGRAIPALLGLLIAGNTSGQGSRWSLIAAGAVIVLSLTRWFTTRLRVTPEQIQLRHGLVRRQTLSAPLDRVRTVDVTAHLLHRVLGLARVVIGTGTSDRRGRGRLVLDGLTVDAATQLRDDLLHRRGGAPEAAATTAGGEYEIARLDPAWIRYAPFTLSGVLTGVIIYGFALRLNNEAHLNLLKLGPLHRAGLALRHTPVVLDAVAVAVAVIVFVAIASTVGYVLAFWDFRLTRHDGGTLHVARGLITSRATSIERRRLVGVELSELFMLRLVRGARTLAIATGLRARRGAERGGEVLLPPAPRAVAVAVAAAVLETPRPFTAPLRPHGRNALRRRLVRAEAGALLAIGAVEAIHAVGGRVGWLVFVSLALIPLAVPLATDRFRNLGHAYVDGYVVARSGSLLRRTNALRADSVIGWNLTSTFFQRRLRLTTLTATTAAGKQHYRILDADADEAVAFADATLPGLLTDFLR